MSEYIRGLYEGMERILDTVKTAEVIASASIYGMKFFEVRLEDSEGKYVDTVNLNLPELKRMGIVSRLNSFKKLQTWLDTEEGKQYALGIAKRKNERQKQKYSQEKG